MTEGFVAWMSSQKSLSAVIKTEKNMKKLQLSVLTISLTAAMSASGQVYTDGNPGDWSGGAGATTVPSGTGGVIAPNGGSSFTQLYNLHDDYQAGYGDGPYSFYGNGGSSVYNGAFYQSVAIYIDTSWAPAAAATGGPTSPTAFWLDMTPYHTDPNNYGAEHNFRFGATGNQVNVSVDGLGSLLYSITTSGWYDFQMIWQKGANPIDPVITDMNIYDPTGALVATTQVLANSPGGPFDSADLAGNGYLWFGVWQNGFAGDTLDVANVATAPVPEPGIMTMFVSGMLLLTCSRITLRKLRKNRAA
jgi:hypothetical protein